MKRQNTHINNDMPKTIVNIILDASGSMDSCREGTIEGFNNYIRKLRKEKNEILVSLTLFNTAFEKRYSLLPIKEVPVLGLATYRPDGMTALWDAAVDTTEECYEKSKEFKIKPAIICAIITDGYENSSTRHDQTCMNDLVEKLKKEENWTFVYLGANQDSWATASHVSMDMGNVANFKSTNNGMRAAFSAMAVGTSSVNLNAMNYGGGGGGGSLNSASFFAGSKDNTNMIKAGTGKGGGGINGTA